MCPTHCLFFYKKHIPSFTHCIRTLKTQTLQFQFPQINSQSNQNTKTHKNGDIITNVVFVRVNYLLFSRMFFHRKFSCCFILCKIYFLRIRILRFLSSAATEVSTSTTFTTTHTFTSMPRTTPPTACH